MSPERNELGRRQFVQAAGAGIAGAASLSAGASRSTAQSVDEAPDEDEYEDILAEMEGDGTEESPYVITDVVELQAMIGDVQARYQLGNDIDASATAEWNDGAGFKPILAPPPEDEDTESEEENQQRPNRDFVGQLAGNGHEIAGLTVDRPDEGAAGLIFVNRGAILDLSITDATIAGKTSGILAAVSSGGLRGVTVQGSVSGQENVGGMVGLNRGAIVEADANAEVSGQQRVGGLIGKNDGNVGGTTVDGRVEGESKIGGAFGTISKAGTVGGVDTAATVSGTNQVGGFVGYHSGRASGSTATGDVTGEKNVGGFAGEMWGQLLGVTARGAVDGNENVGGLAGVTHGKVRACSTHGDVVGTTNVGGVVGWGSASTAVTQVYTLSSVTGESAVGALAGLFGWEFLGDDETAELSRGYWDLSATDHDPVGTVRTGDGSVSVAEETLSGLDPDQFVGTGATTHMPEFDFEEQWRALPDRTPVPRAQAQSQFEITNISSTTITVRQDETFDIEVDIENTGEYYGTQTVTLVIDGTEFESVEQELDAGESTRVVLSDLAASEIPVGTYTFRVQTRNDSVEGTLEVDSAPPGGNDDDTPGDSNGDETPGGDTESTPSGADGDGPGFGVGGAVVGIGTGIALLRQRLGRDE